MYPCAVGLRWWDGRVSVGCEGGVEFEVGGWVGRVRKWFRNGWERWVGGNVWLRWCYDKTVHVACCHGVKVKK